MIATTLRRGTESNSFFKEESGISAGPIPVHQQVPTQERPQCSVQLVHTQLLGEIGKTLEKLPLTHAALGYLQLDTRVATLQVATPLGGRTA